jgi:LacI family transcriptional regulator
LEGDSLARDSQEIALAFPRGAHQEVFIEGVLKYARDEGRDWTYLIAPEWLSLSVLHLVDWPGSGVIAALNTPKEAACAAKFHLPIVNMSSALAKSPVPRSIVDNCAIGELAAEHLLERGFQNYAYYGMRDIAYSSQRFAGFAGRLQGGDYAVSSLESAATFRIRGKFWLQQRGALAEWLAQLPLPCGLFAVSDVRARQVIEACHHLEIKVPEQIAVIGVDDQQIICEHTHPSISSIARDNILEGYSAAALLDRVMRSRRSAAKDQLIRPLQVIARDSTATFAVSDDRLRLALEYFRKHLEDPVTVTELCRCAGVSRRWLEYAFRDKLDETPYQYIRRQRLEHARRLLTDEPESKIYSIAKRIGFSSAKQLTKAFRREFGCSPREYRNGNGSA